MSLEGECDFLKLSVFLGQVIGVVLSVPSRLILFVSEATDYRL